MIQNMVGHACSIFLLIVIDRASKTWALQKCADISQIYNKYLECTVIHNRGISWNMLEQSSSWVQLLLLAVILMVTIALSIQAYYRLTKGHGIWPETLIIAGAIGNAVDRIRYGYVIDFIHLHYYDYSWPLFNVADICIVLGVLLLFIRIVRQEYT